MFWRIVLYCFKKSKNATETQKVCAVSGEGAETDGTWQKWFVKCPGTRDVGAK